MIIGANMNALSYKTGNPNVIFSDFPDVDVIRVEDTYYMVSTTMYFMPGCVILRSYNLLDWEFCSYVYDELEFTDGQTLKNNKGIYGNGMWAASLRYHNGLFYVSFVSNDTRKTYLYTSPKITGPWKKSTIQGFYHDMSLFFDDDGKTYIISGNTNIRIVEMENDLSAPKKGGLDKIIIFDDKEKVGLGYEGSHFYKINGKYYNFMIHIPKGKIRTEACYVSDKIEGPYIGGDVFCADYNNWHSGVAQGGIVQQNDGKWFGVLFQDHGALGRIPILVPVNWKDDFPIFGIDGKVPSQITVLDNNPNYKYEPLYSSDFCDSNGNLKSCWQWNHIHDSLLASVKDNKLSIKTDKTVLNVTQAANTLTQRTFTQNCTGSVTVDASNIKDGDFAGLCALEGQYAFIAVTKEKLKYKLVLAYHKLDHSTWTMNIFDNQKAEILNEIALPSKKVRLQLKFTLYQGTEKVQAYYFDEMKKTFVSLGQSCALTYSLDHFTGVRFAMFNFSTIDFGGIATFSDFKYEF